MSKLALIKETLKGVKDTLIDFIDLNVMRVNTVEFNDGVVLTGSDTEEIKNVSQEGDKIIITIENGDGEMWTYDLTDEAIVIDDLVYIAEYITTKLEINF